MQPWKVELLEFEKVYLIDLLDECRNNLSLAAEVSGMQRHQLRRMLTRNKIKVPDIYTKPLPNGRGVGTYHRSSYKGNRNAAK